MEYIVNFREKYSKYGVTTEELDTNYRATDGLIDVASRLIVNNTKRLEKNMKAYDGQNYSFELNDIVHRHFDSDLEEFRFILDNLNRLHNTDFVDKHGKAYALSYRDMAVIVKTNEDAARIIGFFERNNIPCIADSGSGVLSGPSSPWPWTASHTFLTVPDTRQTRFQKWMNLQKDMQMRWEATNRNFETGCRR